MNKLVSNYPDTPGYRALGTSKDAAEAVAPVAVRLRGRVLAGFKDALDGMTADEMASRLNLSILAVRPRCSELVRLGELQRTAERRKNSTGMSAAVLRISDPLPTRFEISTSSPAAPGGTQLAMKLDGGRS
jgi:hypothetical protein